LLLIFAVYSRLEMSTCCNLHQSNSFRLHVPRVIGTLNNWQQAKRANAFERIGAICPSPHLIIAQCRAIEPDLRPVSSDGWFQLHHCVKAGGSSGIRVQLSTELSFAFVVGRFFFAMFWRNAPEYFGPGQFAPRRI